jgi:glycosyltransferase involved in cell wall biosynthesis
MRIGIYNRWLHTMGGGERETAAFARVLQGQHAVDLLCHQPIDLHLFARQLNLPLPEVRSRVLTFDPDYRAVADASADYDLFVNMSHGDLFVPRARHNVLRVFFPAALDVGPDAPLVLTRGFYAPEEQRGMVFAWTGREAEVLLSPPKHPGAAMLHLRLHGWRPPAAAPAQVRLFVDELEVAQRTVPMDGAWFDWQARLPARSASSSPLRVRFVTSTFHPRESGISDDARELGVAIAGLRVEARGWLLRPGRQPIWLAPDAAAYHGMLARMGQSAISAHDLLLANSHFTRQWITRRWNQSSTVLYPPVDTTNIVPRTKQPMILSIGRFFAGSHNKKHLPMIQAFRALCDAGLQGWEFHLVGGCDQTRPEHRAYLEQARTAAVGYPIVFHIDAPFDELRALLGAASIFWHATGFEEDEEQAPESFEHFGIATVEAMAAGCVPIVIARAGQLEIVEPERNGMLWNTLPELRARTREVIDDAELRARLRIGARERSLQFGAERFAREVRALVAGLEDALR